MSVPSENMMQLLRELALLKESDAKYESSSASELDISEFERRQNRRREITDQIKAMGGTAD